MRYKTSFVVWYGLLDSKILTCAKYECNGKRML